MRTPAALLALLATIACDGDPTGPGGGDPITELPRALSGVEQELITASNGFGMELMRRVVAEEDGPNVVLSPLSASIALGMALNGAAGTTFDAMRETLGYGDLTQAEINAAYRELLDLLTGLDPTVEIGIANSVWADEGFPFRQSFHDAVMAAFDARLETRDLQDPAAVTAINDWVAEATNGFIPTLLDRIDPEIVLFLVNAIYFDGSWTTRFDTDETVSAPFRRADGSDVTVDLMSLRQHVAPVHFGERYTAVELAYGGGAFGMVVVVPRGETTARELAAELSAPWWEGLVDGLAEAEVDRIALPRFTLTWGTALNDALKAMGMEEAFTPGGADFTNLSPQGDQLFINRVMQKSFIEVDEAGTRAAAVTSVEFGVVSVPPQVVADRPFLFAIRDRISGTVLFTGLVGDPTAE
ncbi:MAG: serpin family protein [Longimicrobiales bacterium]|nr:serpin family protein [Longimicrobiales bacterium]